MVQKDYVSRGNSSGTRRKTANRKKKRFSSGITKTMVALATAVLITFIGGLYFIVHNKSDEKIILPNCGKNTESGLPPKPEERWRYIKELENRQIGVQFSSESTADRKVNSPVQMTDEQHQLLEQMQTDIRRKTPHLNEVPYNNQSKASAAATDKIQQTTGIPHNPFNQQPMQAMRETAMAKVTAQPVQLECLTSPQKHQMSKTAHIQLHQKSNDPNTAKESRKEKPKHWLIQCGSFKTMDKTESVRAKLALVGIESRITSDDGWNRVLLGPYSSHASTDKILQNVRDAGVSNCISVAVRG